MPMKRVLQLCAVDFTVKNFLAELIEFLEAKGLEVHVGCRRGAFWDDLVGRGYRMVDLPFTRGANPAANLRALWVLWRHLARSPYEIVHVHTPIVGVLGRLAARWARVPIRLYTAHGFYFHDDMHPAFRRFCVAVERFAARRGHFVFTQSDEDRQSAIRERICRPDDIATIGNGIDTKRFDPAAIAPEARAALRKELRLSEASPTVGIVARIVREKGVFELADAVAAVRRDLPDVRVVWIGGALESDRDDSTIAFRRRLESLGIADHVRFTGFRNDVPALMSLCNVYTLPSYREGMPRSILEAMSMALPVVATRIRGCREEVVEGETGFLVPPRDAAALADRLARLLAHPDGARRMGEAGRRRAVEHFDFRLVLDRQWRVYERLMRERKNGNRILISPLHSELSGFRREMSLCACPNSIKTGPQETPWVKRALSALFLAPGFSRWGHDRPSFSPSRLEPGFSTGLQPSVSPRPQQNAEAASRSRAEACFPGQTLSDPPAEAGGKEEPAEAG